jgi:predicted oxidoreductase
MRAFELFVSHTCFSPRGAAGFGQSQALKLNLTRAIGVSNFQTSHLEEILAICETPPAVNQWCDSPHRPAHSIHFHTKCMSILHPQSLVMAEIEQWFDQSASSAALPDCLWLLENTQDADVGSSSMHIGGHDDETIKFSQLHGITYEAYSPLGGDDLGGRSVMTYPAVKQIAASHGVSGAQVALRWVVQQGCALTTATGAPDQVSLVCCFGAPCFELTDTLGALDPGNVQYMQEDLQVLDGFTLTAKEMATLSAVHGVPPPQWA